MLLARKVTYYVIFKWNTVANYAVSVKILYRNEQPVTVSDARCGQRRG
jgi:hypothetical protein